MSTDSETTAEVSRSTITSGMSEELRVKMRAAVVKQINTANVTKPTKESGEVKPVTLRTTNDDASVPSFLNTLLTDKATEGRILFSTLMGISPSSVKTITNRPDFSVKTFASKTWDSEVEPFIPSVSPTYQPDIAVSYDILVGWELNDNVMVYGPPGVGKTTLIQHLAALLNMPCIRIVGRGDMETGPVLGQPTVEAGSLGWTDGLFTSAARHGGIFLCDEPWIIPAEIMMGINSVLEDNRTLVLSDCPRDSRDRIVSVSKDLRVAFCDNTGGQGDLAGRHAGVNVQNTATLDRFKTSIYMDYMPQSREVSMITATVPEIKSDTVSMMCKYAKLVRNAYMQGEMSVTMSPRTLISWAQKAALYESISASFKVAFLAKLVEDSEIAAARNMYLTVFGEDYKA